MSSFPEPPAGPSAAPFEIETTGHYLVLLDDDAVGAGVRALRDAAGLEVEEAPSAATRGMPAEELESTDNFVFPELGVAVVSPDPDQVGALAAATREAPSVLALEPERVVYAIDAAVGDSTAGAEAAGLSPEYLRGYRDAIDSLLGRLGGPGAAATAAPGAAAAARFDEAQATWGLQITKTLDSRATGRGVRVAVLDTGFALKHPDFAGRRITHRSFIDGEAVEDLHGHGTHCIGTACGPRQPTRLPRYGVAFQAEIFAGKVLSNRGRGADRGILAGIAWAMANKCQLVSMSLGGAVRPGDRFSAVFETAARRALEAGTAIIAAAGNDSKRNAGVTNPVSHPANCPSIMAVAALDRALAVASFSNSGINPDGGQVDIAGPGVGVFSSWPLPATYNTISGTSMATPHVAGIAALHLQANPGMHPAALMCHLARTARRLTASSADVGAGLVQAP